MAFKRSGVRFPSPPLGRGKQMFGDGIWLEGTHGRAGIAQLVEHNLAKVGVAGSSPVSRSGRYDTKAAPRGVVPAETSWAVSSVG
jgi:hypothetical protein